MEDRALIDLKAALSRLMPDAQAVRRLLHVSGVSLEGLRWQDDPEAMWERIVNHCELQGRDALESLLVELLERFPGQEQVARVLRSLSKNTLEAPEAAPDGGSLKEAIVRDPLEGTEMLIAFAEARGKGGVVLLQLKRCYRVLEDIAQSRRRHGQTMRHEKLWKQSVYEILALADQVER